MGDHSQRDHQAAHFVPVTDSDLYWSKHTMDQDPRKTSYETVKAKCPVFEGGACPYTKIKSELSGLQGNCPSFKQGGCPFNDLQGKTVEDTIQKLVEMKTQCPAKDAHEKALKAILQLSTSEEKAHGKSPFFSDGCLYSAAVTFEELKGKWPFKGACPYQELLTPEFRALAKGCSAFKDGCPFQKCKSIDELLNKMVEMKAQVPASAKEKVSQALKAIADLSLAKQKEHGECPFFAHGCIFKSFS